MTRKLGLLLVVIVGLLSACVMPEPAPIEREIPVLNNDLAEGQLSRTHKVPGERFEFITSYYTEYDTSRWRVTDSKNLKMQARIKVLGEGEGVEVLVEHVHIDISLKSKYAMLDGWSIDSMDDKLHTGPQAGFLVTELYPYENIFAIEGYSETLIEGWGYWTSTYGYSELKEYRLTEDTLVKKGGVYANKVQVVYDLLIKYPGEIQYHTRSLIDEFLIPVGQ